MMLGKTQLHNWNKETDEIHPFGSVKEAADFFADIGRRDVKKTKVGRFNVSTIFLVLDHGWGGRPMWFETMIFDGKGAAFEVYQERYETGKEARIGHEKAVKMVEEFLAKEARANQAKDGLWRLLHTTISACESCISGFKRWSRILAARLFRNS